LSSAVGVAESYAPAPAEECLAGSVGILLLTSRIVVTRAARPVVVWLIGVGLALALVVAFLLILYA